MADTLSTYFAVFKADLDGFTRPLREAQKEAQELNNAAKPLTNLFKDIGESATRFGSILTVGLTAPIVAFGAVAVKNFDESAKAIAVMEAALISTEGAAGKTAEQLVALSKSLETKSIHDNDEILRSIIDTLLTFGNVSGDVFDRAAEAALNLADRFGGDLQAAAIKVGKALDDPIKGLAGLTKAGVTFTQAEKDVLKALVETGHQAEAQGIILDKLNSKVEGTSEALSKVGTGPMKQLQIQIGNMSESWGKLITETMNPFITKTTEVVKWIDTWSESTKVLVGGAAGIAAALGPALLAIGQMSFGISAMIPLLTKLSVTFLGAEGSALLFSTTMAAIPWIAATAGAAALGVGIGMIINKMIEASGHQKQFDSILNTLVKTIPGFSLLATGTAQADDAAKSYNFTLAAQQKYLKDSGKTLEDLSATSADAAKKQDALKTNLKALSDAAAQSAARVTDLEAAQKAGVLAAAANAKAVKDQEKAYKDFIVTVETKRDVIPTFQADLAKATDEATAKIKELALVAKEKYMEVLNAQFSTFQSTMQGISDSADAMIPEMQRTMDHIKGIEDANAQHTKDNLDALSKKQKESADSVQKVWETAAGNITSGMAKAFTDTIFNGGNFLTKMVDLAKSVAEQMLQSLLVGFFAPFTAKLASFGATIGGMIPGFGGAAGAAGTAATGAAGAAGGGGGGGAAGAAAALLTNPWLIGAGAGMIAIGAWLKSQAHHEANTLVQQIENPFWKSLLSILPSDRYSDLAALPSAQARGIIEQLLALNANYMALGNQFAMGGSDEAKVWEQSKKNTQPPLRGFLDALSIAEASGKVAPGAPGSPEVVGTTMDDLKRMYPQIKGFALGTDYVPKTGLYQLHEGEAVIPEGQNRGGLVINFGDIHVSGTGGQAADEWFDSFIKRIQQNRGQLKYRLRTALA